MNRYAQCALIAILSIVATARVSQTLGANYSWNTSGGNWGVAPEWNPATVPGPADTAWILDGGTASIGAFVNASCGTLVLGGTFGGNVQLVNNLAAGSGGELIGYTGSGSFNQTAGTNSTTNVYLGYNALGSGSYSLSGGSLATSGNLAVGATGNGSFTQSGGAVSALFEYVGYFGSGGFTQSGGMNTMNSSSGELVLGYDSNGSYNLTGGTLSTDIEYVGNGLGSGSGSFTQSGGVHSVANLGINANPSFASTYNLSGSGVLLGGLETVGGGSFTQSGGSNLIAGTLWVDQGSYNLSGSGVLVAGAEIAGEDGGVFTQSGGSNLISSYLYLGSPGGFNLNGGLLRVGGITYYELEPFNFGGGTMQMLAGFVSLVPIDLNVPGSIGTLDTYGNTLTLSTTLYGPGGMNKGGAGALNLGGTDIYTGLTSVSGGTLVLPLDIPSTSSFTAESGGTLLFPGTTLNLNSRFICAMAGGSVVYQDATVNGGFLRGPGVHTFVAGFNNSMNGMTIDNGAVLQQSGSASFTDVSNAGQINDNSNAVLTWQGASNATSGQINVSGSASLNVSEWYNDGVITINNGGLLNNSVSRLVSGGGSRITVNSGGTLNADSNAEGVTLDLDGALLVNNGTVTGTTNVYYGATAQGSGTFGLINVYEGGTLLISPSASPVAPAAVVSGGSVAGAGSSALPVATDGAYLVAPNATDRLTFSGDFSGSGSITKLVRARSCCRARTRTQAGRSCSREP